MKLTIFLKGCKMKFCVVLNKGLCTGCTGLAEKDWCGPFKCPEYIKYVKEKQKDVNRYNG